MYRALRPDGLFAFPIGAPPPIASGRYWALLGFDLAMQVRNAVWHPPFVMYYGTCRLHAVRNDLTAAGFTVTTVPLTALGRREDGSPPVPACPRTQNLGVQVLANSSHHMDRAAGWSYRCWARNRSSDGSPIV
ncbi:hypothetical protein [Acrocarpospora sp. B8E8]|uniref:hypothetical protein n=1 Tax=Acrocarpospora sp. B8E8 TaxID=3153572 RepID=UPI00325CDE33